MAAFLKLAAREFIDPVPPVLVGEVCDDRLTAWRQMQDCRDLEVSEEGEGEAARDGSRSHHEKVGDVSFFVESDPLEHAEALLFVDDHKFEVFERNILRKERMGADRNVDFAVLQSGKERWARRTRYGACHEGEPHAERFHQVGGDRSVLAGQ